MNYIKPKLRNIIKLELLNAIWMLKFSLFRSKEYIYYLPTEVFNNIKTTAEYYSSWSY